MREHGSLTGLSLSLPVMMFCLLIGISACSTKGSAPVYNRPVSPSQQGVTTAATNKPVSPSAHRYKSSRTYYLVQPGDTLYSIAWRHYLEHELLAAWNGIKAPRYSIYPGQRLRLKPPEVRKTRHRQPTVNTPVKKVVTKAQPTTPVVRPVAKPPPNPTPVKSAAVKKRVATNQQKRVKLAWRWPTKGRVVQTFSSSDQNRKGVRIGGQIGQPIKAAEAGRVVYAGGGLVGYGNLVIIKHDKNYLSAYGYNRKLLVKEGDNLAKGDIVAHMGSPHSGGQPVLHFEIRKQGKPINPLPLLPRK
ncbi:MAG: peptidoglycan DD-metalloendopeptidase family protein [Candidatus Thiodiazotropha lotti]|uniref:Peptidoglycan DD-metalloendopeptidase family protein n=1 Tax=Candidatus Thiodiazotropha lotti TaxID=2792787 RepID=A0A9E4K5T5_9GAMM|nr:peptidoglycan DD-metalloendopeptidase family protein [Candidatus Thiodiazotropha lotti]MCG7939817.1 peptidoglycan DD-metalloendopeptidase family protein [Candidatus Thiodiazotropha lotti]MCG7987759.1 peptidoglycan DD-metalloendopeptidase family protein [Candidatus Thiodiazotropha lotti]MCG8005017.1 peptidoglycan DD-metalloendopeptidase family protein [Candidatus Thiodiazotropha lotti]MCG8012469.1 peptidoglycan DD-metalloendopeptidase family protein [Candidatus Thiodiazotropha lotti]